PWLSEMLRTLASIGERLPVLFPVHPRTRQRISDAGIQVPGDRVRLIDPLSYLDFLGLQTRASLVITDSGGIQEETTVLGVPCLTVRENTERPVTVELGTNILVGRCMTTLLREANNILDGHAKSGTIPPLWDGHAGERIAAILTR
ncbi:MAG: UDP-N-acetylglucosamine 2-epimerase, partial [Terriglobales bacterium]